MFGKINAFVNDIVKGNINFAIEGTLETDDNSYELVCTSSPIKEKLFKIIYSKYLKQFAQQDPFTKSEIGTLIDLKEIAPKQYHGQLVSIVPARGVQSIVKPYTILSKELKSAKIIRQEKGWVLIIELEGLFK